MDTTTKKNCAGARTRRHPDLAWLLAVAMLSAGMMACAPEPESAETPTIATPISDGLTIDFSSHTRLAGVFSKGQQHLAFEFAVAADGGNTLTFRRSNGALLVRSTFIADEQMVEFGGAQTVLRGPRGDLASATSGLGAEDNAAIALVKDDPALGLIEDLPGALQKRGGLDLTVLPRFPRHPTNHAAFSCGNEFLNTICPGLINLGYVGCWYVCFWNHDLCRTCVIAHALPCAGCSGI